jgi:ketosteroid isomerase-like protein
MPWPGQSEDCRIWVYQLGTEGDRFVTYVGRNVSGKHFRNSEILTVHDGKIVEAEVYFGWTIPHEAPNGGFIDQKSS